MSNHEGVRIDPRAVVEDDANIGEGTSIWHFAHVRGGSKIGSSCIIGKGAYVDIGVKIGDNCKIQNGAMLYNGVSVGDEVFVGPHAVFTNDLRPRAHIWDEGRMCRTEVQDGASIGANATIICGITIGEYALIGSGAVVTKDVPPYSLVIGNPGKIIGKVDKKGHRVE